MGRFLWTLVALEKRAQQMGANAVVNIVSYYQKNEMVSTTEFECRVGNVIAKVWLKGDLVRIADGQIRGAGINTSIFSSGENDHIKRRQI